MAALRHADLEPVAIFRPSWYFTADYLIQRLGAYLPIVRKIQLSTLKRMVVPLNLVRFAGHCVPARIVEASFAHPDLSVRGPAGLALKQHGIRRGK